MSIRLLIALEAAVEVEAMEAAVVGLAEAEAMVAEAAMVGVATDLKVRCPKPHFPCVN